MYKYVHVNKNIGGYENSKIPKIFITDANIAIRLLHARNKVLAGNYDERPEFREFREKVGYSNYVAPSFSILELATRGLRQPIDESLAERYKEGFSFYFSNFENQTLFGMKDLYNLESYYKNAFPQVFLRLLLAAKIMQTVKGGRKTLINRMNIYIDYHLDNNLRSIALIYDLILRIFSHDTGSASFLNNDGKGIVDSCRSSALDIVHAKYSIDLIYQIAHIHSAVPATYFVTEEKRLHELATRFIIGGVIWNEEQDKIGVSFAGLQQPDYLKNDQWESIKSILQKLQDHRAPLVDFTDESPLVLEPLIQSLIKELQPLKNN